MACATLKRHLDWEPVLGGRPAKRGRYTPLCKSPQSTPPRPKDPSPFTDSTTPRLTPERMAANIRDEIRRLHKRKQLQYIYPESNCRSGRTTDTMNDSGSDAGSSSGAESPTPLSVPQPHIPRAEKALFTFKQVGMICERMVRERETELREEYDQVLHTKLAEQYNTFVKFTYDQIQKSFDSAPSYLS